MTDLAARPTITNLGADMADGKDAKIINLEEYRNKKSGQINVRRHPSARIPRTAINLQQFTISPESRTGIGYAVDVDKMSGEERETWADAAIAVSSMSDSEIHGHAANHGLLPVHTDILEMPNIDYSKVRAKLLDTPGFVNKFKKSK